MSVGQKLRQSRKEQNISLRQVADETKIGMFFLDAMERDDIDSLPGGVYGRSFLRAYCRFLGLDEKPLVEEYHRQFEITPISKIYEDENQRDNQRFLRRRRNLTIFMCSVFFVLVLVTLWLLKSYSSASRRNLTEVETASHGDIPASFQNIADPVASSPTGSREESGQEKEDSVVSDDFLDTDSQISTVPQSQSSPSSSLPYNDPLTMIPVDGGSVDRIEDLFGIQALDQVWVEVEVDGNSMTRRLMALGEVRFYRYGRVNRVNIGDISKIAIQDGRTYLQRVSSMPAYPGWIEFGPGKFAERLAKISDFQ